MSKEPGGPAFLHAVVRTTHSRSVRFATMRCRGCCPRLDGSSCEHTGHSSRLRTRRAIQTRSRATFPGDDVVFEVSHRLLSPLRGRFTMRVSGAATAEWGSAKEPD